MVPLPPPAAPVSVYTFIKVFLAAFNKAILVFCLLPYYSISLVGDRSIGRPPVVNLLSGEFYFFPSRESAMISDIAIRAVKIHITTA